MMKCLDGTYANTKVVVCFEILIDFDRSSRVLTKVSFLYSFFFFELFRTFCFSLPDLCMVVPAFSLQHWIAIGDSQIYHFISVPFFIFFKSDAEVSNLLNVNKQGAPESI